MKSLSIREKYSKRDMSKRIELTSATETENTDEEDEEDETEKEDILAKKSKKQSNIRKREVLHNTQRHSSASHTLPPLAIEKTFEQKLGIFKIRGTMAVVLATVLMSIIFAGHFYASVVVLTLTALTYREIIALKRNAQKDKKLPYFFFLRWFSFFLTIYGCGYSWILPLTDGLGIPRSPLLEILVTHHLIITYFLAFLGFVLFILSLRRFSLRYQFSQFAIMHLTCLFVVGQSVFHISNISDGLIWFMISCTTVTFNDIFAYLFGVTMGRTRLIRLSPNKTVEGYVGGAIVTLIISVLLGSILPNYDVFVCPQREVKFRPFAMWFDLHCEPNHVFKPHDFRYPDWVFQLTGLDGFTMKPAVLHSLVLGIFAAFFAPFGGFFASAFKRALRIKDFSDSLPGHGGYTDRFDCQILMGMFTFLYVRTFVRVRKPAVDYIIRLVSRLSEEERKSLLDLISNL